MIPFSPPHIDQEIIDEVVAALKSGWITTGPRTKQFEKDLSVFGFPLYSLRSASNQAIRERPQ